MSKSYMSYEEFIAKKRLVRPHLDKYYAGHVRTCLDFCGYNRTNLTRLAAVSRVSAATQNQAFNARLFLFAELSAGSLKVWLMPSVGRPAGTFPWVFPGMR